MHREARPANQIQTGESYYDRLNRTSLIVENPYYMEEKANKY
jgi:hypothetical protein